MVVVRHNSVRVAPAIEEPSLAGCWSKYRRAEGHAQTLEGLLTEFGDSKPYRITGKFDPKERAVIMTAEVLHKPDTILWGLLLGDIVHNLRSALDHLVWQLALLSGVKKPGTHLQFPIESTGAGYWSQRKDGKPSTREHRLKGVAERYRTPIDQAQPYLAGQDATAHPLSVLAHLSNIDKHRFIHPAFSVVDDKSPQRVKLIANPDAGQMTEVVHEPFPTDGKAEIGRVVFECPGPKPDVEVQGDLPLIVGFSDRGVRTKDLGRILEAVAYILQGYSASFATDNAT